MLLLKSVFSFIVVVLTFSASLANARLPEFTELIAKNSPAVVKIVSLQSSNSRANSRSNPQLDQLPPFFRRHFEQQPQRDNKKLRPTGTGSGFVVSSDGYILTNNHVIDDADKITVRLNDRSEYDATVIGTDSLSDLALLKIDTDDLPFVEFSDSSELAVGSWVVAIGSPFGMDYSASAGIVSAIGRSLPSESGSNYVPFIQTDVAINPGNSGGPLFNMDGQVVGINSQIYTRSGGYMGLSFAIPSNVAINVIRQLKDTGNVERGFLGVSIQDIDKDLAESFGLDKPAGALISKVYPDSPAEKSGLEDGDIILKIDDKDIEFSYDLPHIIGLVTPGDKVKALLMRQGKRKTITIKVGSIVSGNETASNNNSNIIQEKLGLEVADISERDARRIKIRAGVEVISVEPNSPADNLGLVEGDIIVQLGYNKFFDVSEMDAIIQDVPSGKRIPIRFFRGNNAYYHTIKIR